jgi:CubicO group peptidase (beta-lactamase class C family)
MPRVDSAPAVDDLSPLLEKHLKKNRFPAFAAAVVRGTNVIASGVAGVRKIGEKEPVTLDDKFHIGSCTKSMTALLAAYLDAENVIPLGTTVAKALPDWKIPGEVEQVTLELLLQNRSGLGNEPDPKLWRRAFSDSGEPSQQRRRFLESFLADGLKAKPGDKYIYSNPGFSLAGAMLETAAKKSWEELIRERVFSPLNLNSGGFGPPGVSGELNQPWGHEWRNGSAVAVPPSDNPPAIAPAGTVHLSILDFARYVASHLQAAQGKVPALRQYRRALYNPPDGSDYAMGWIVTDRPWAGGKALTHAGSNTMFFTVIWIAPERDFACVVATNVGDRGNKVAAGCDAVVGDLIKQFLLKQDSK